MHVTMYVLQTVHYTVQLQDVITSVTCANCNSTH